MRLVVTVMALSVLGIGCSSSIGEPPLDANASAACDDGTRNGDETDTDCGGSCQACSVGLGCDSATDCETRTCAAGVCLAPTSCRLIAEASGATPPVSGVYGLTVEGTAFDAYCDFDFDGGGWTLIMKLTTGTATFAFGAPLWSDDVLVAADDLSPHTDPLAGTEAKLASFGLVTGLELRLETTDPAHSIVFSSVGNQTARELFAGDLEQPVLENDIENCAPDFLAAVPSYDPLTMRHAQGHQFFGINGTDDAGGGLESLRFGFASNDEDDNSWQPKQGIGSNTESLLWISHTDCDGCGGCYGTAYDPVATTANLWIR